MPDITGGAPQPVVDLPSNWNPSEVDEFRFTDMQTQALYDLAVRGSTMAGPATISSLFGRDLVAFDAMSEPVLTDRGKATVVARSIVRF